MIYYLPHAILTIYLMAVASGGTFVWAVPLVFFLLFPLLEFLTSKINYQPQRSVHADVSLHLMPLGLSCILYAGFLKVNQAPTAFNFIFLTLSTGVLMGAFGITSAHELIHRRSKASRTLGYYNLMLVHFGHWGIEHVFGHHKNVATLNDPATARKNEIVYSFWFREYFSTYLGAYRINSVKVMAFSAVSVLSSLFVYFTLGAWHLLFWWGASVVAVLLLQTVDYIEHYGLLRKQKEDGLYTAFTAEQAWDTASVLTNILLFNLGLHSHHHLKANTPYDSLEIQEKSQKMPFGYTFMIGLALLPMFFIPMMNKRLQNLEVNNN